jgi:hypothetical protein
MMPDLKDALSKDSINNDLRGIFDILKSDPAGTTIDKNSLHTLLKHVNL